VPGATFASRVAASLNAHLGMDELNVADDRAFVETAARVGSSASLRAEVAGRRASSGLFDMRAFAEDFAALLRRMVERRRNGLAAADLD
jgi:predicted O-linked N-acetylglucosamine transferase (SPINDLY family)